MIAQRIANLRSARLSRRTPAGDRRLRRLNRHTAARARAAGAELVLELPRGGKIRAQDAAVAQATGELLVFSDANSLWERDALKRLVDAFADPDVGYVCGDVSFLDPEGTNQEGLYWRYEMWLRRMESALSSVTAGNGAIYATRRDSYLNVDPLAGHDLSFPFNMVKRGWRAIYVTDARATEKMAPSIEGEFTRKRRMARRTWPTVFSSGLLSPRGYSPLYALMIFSHRILRYLVPFLHVIALAANIALVGQGPLYVVTLALQLALFWEPRWRRLRPRVCCWWPGTTWSPTGRSQPGCGTGCGVSARRSGRRWREHGENRLSALGRWPSADRRPGVADRRPRPLVACALVLCSPADPPRVARQSRSSRRSGRGSVASRFRSSSCARWSRGAEHIGAGLAVLQGDAGSRARVSSCGATRSTSCRTCGMSCAARWRSSGRDRR